MLTLDEIDAAIARAQSTAALAHTPMLDALLDARNRAQQQQESTDQ